MKEKEKEDEEEVGRDDGEKGLQDHGNEDYNWEIK